MPKAFISYRRSDSFGKSFIQKLLQQLENRAGFEKVFLDVDSMPVGEDFRKVTLDAIRKTDYVFVVIGNKWQLLLEAAIAKPKDTDYVRFEIVEALKLKKPIVPILVGGARMPRESQLPDDIRKLTYIQAWKVTTKDLAKPMDRLLTDLGLLYINTLNMRFKQLPGTRSYLSIWPTRLIDYKKFNSDAVGKGPEHPVVDVSWKDANAFAKWLSDKESLIYRLPTDEEWSLAIPDLMEDPGKSAKEKSNDNKELYPWGWSVWPPPGKAGNYWINHKEHGYKNTTSPVGKFPPNAFGFYDLGGNVWEWCANSYNEEDPLNKILRGGSYHRYPIPPKETLYASFRYYSNLNLGQSYYGFRLLLEDFHGFQ